MRALVLAVVVASGLLGGRVDTAQPASAAPIDTVACDVEDAYAKGVVNIDLSDPAGAHQGDKPGNLVVAAR